jgi:hypothetical protein
MHEGIFPKHVIQDISEFKDLYCLQVDIVQYNNGL